MRRIPDGLTKEVLVHLYTEELLTEKQIAEMFDTYQVAISRLRSFWGIPTLGKTGRLERQLPALTSEQREILIGSLLGDGNLSATSGGSARFTESHCKRQEAYLLWKADCLGIYVSSIGPDNKMKSGEVAFEGARFITHACTHLFPLYDLFYPEPERVKVFPKELSRMMTPLVLAVWYMDDGTLAGGHPHITYGLGDVSLSRAVSALRKMGLKPRLNGEGSEVSIGFPGQTDLFFDLVRPYIHPSMVYKLSVDTHRRIVDKNARRLTSGDACSLYHGGMAIKEIASLFHVGTSTVNRRLLSEEGYVPRMGRPKRKYSLLAAQTALTDYKAQEWASLPEKDQERWIQGVADILSGTDFPFVPLTDVEKETARVVRTVMRQEGFRITPWSTAGIRLCSHFFPNRFKAVAKSGISAYEAWYRRDRLETAIRFQLEHGDPVTPIRVLRAITMRERTPTVFRPTVTKFLCERYGCPGGTVYDPCSGYGGRLLGAILSGMFYVGVDADPDTVKGNMALAEAVGAREAATVHVGQAECFDAPESNLVLTSPPYFNRERYLGERQSWVRHGDSFESWVSGFFTPMVERAVIGLKPGGHLVLNVANIRAGRRVFPLVARAMEVVQATGLSHVETLEMPLAAINRRAPVEPVLVFRK